MVKVKSVSKPARPLESIELAAVPPEPQLPGAAGSLGGNKSLAEKHVVAHGRRSALESILGDTDDRTRILETTLTPWRQICALEIEGKDGQRFIGTGWFAGPRTLITAGHCVHHPDLGGWAERITVNPGRNGDTLPFKGAVATRVSAIDAWTGSQDPDFDYGVIHLDTDLGSELGWFAIDALGDAALARRMVNISGYPLKPGFGKEQWFHSNGVLRTTQRRIFYDVDTTGGQSGAPVWIYPDGSDTPLVVAIHAYGVGGTPSNLQIEANSAPRITADVLTLIKGWVEQ
ncbi:serine protease [Mesorhizobium sp. M0924]|uniref:trypsin-like serine peptidase n=1 Tax=unclassified Mesorhizobium TaxID=325217 RepID=UPI00333C555D